MTDRGLLEMAAKAAGHSLTKGSAGYREFLCKGGVEWNPLEDDGDALRLALSMDVLIDIDLGEHETVVAFTTPNGTECGIREGHGVNRRAATRRAIVRAAAAIGRAMP